MKKSIITLAIAMAASIIGLNCAHSQSRAFTQVEGPSFSAKLATAQSRALAGSSYWVAYGFEVRPHVGFDLAVETNGTKVIAGATGSDETPNLGVFMLYHDKGGKPERIEVYNLDRQRDYEGMPVYWLGRVPTSESLDFLVSLIPQRNDSTAAENLTDAIALHNDSRTGTILEDLLHHAAQEGVRRESAFWLGRLPGHLQSLADVVSDERAALSVRKQAVMAIGKSREEGSGAILQRLYTPLLRRELREEILDAAAKNRQDPAVDLLTSVELRSDDITLKNRARDLLSKMSGKKEKDKAGKPADKLKNAIQ